jgi:hypothetical protein
VKRKCANRCKREARFTTPGLKAFCSTECASEFAKKEVTKEYAKEEKAKRKELRARKDKLNETVPHWTKKVQTEFNKYVRLRDKNMPCISCGKEATKEFLTGSGWDCGHYRSVGSSPELRFEPLNAHKQCVKCNQFKSGNVVEYRIELARRIGPKNLEWLEGPHEPKRYRVPELKELHEHFKGLNRINENN